MSANFDRGGDGGFTAAGHESQRRRHLSSLPKRASRVRRTSHALTKGVGRMGRYVEPRAPTEVIEPEIDALKPHPYVVKLRQLRDSFPKALRVEYGTIAKAVGGDVRGARFTRKREMLYRVQKVKLRKLALKESREQFLNTIDTKEINDQLDDSLYDADRGAGCQKRWCTIRRTKIHCQIFI